MQNISTNDVKSLLKALEKENYQKAEKIFDELIAQRDTEVIQQINNLAHNLQVTLDQLGPDLDLLRHTKHDLPDASERLQYVLNSTEEASNKTLSASENLVALIENMEAKNRDDDLVTLLEEAKSEVTNIMMAQSFQDLTGQVLNRVILLVTSLEQSLLELIDHSGIDLHQLDLNVSEEARKAEDMKGVGPNVTKSSQKETVQSQDDVDDLLGDLGI